MAPVAKKLQRSVTAPKRKEAPKKLVKKVKAVRSSSKSPPKTLLRKRDQKAARKVEAKLTKVKRSVSVKPISRSKSIAKVTKAPAKTASVISSSKKNTVSPPKQPAKKAADNKMAEKKSALKKNTDKKVADKKPQRSVSKAKEESKK